MTQEPARAPRRHRRGAVAAMATIALTASMAVTASAASAAPASTPAAKSAPPKSDVRELDPKPKLSTKKLTLSNGARAKVRAAAAGETPAVGTTRTLLAL